jgi:uncharacterized protein YjbJ (UPF0337 family)
MSSFVNAIKDRVVGAVEENVGYLVGNTDMEARGREKREHGAEEAATFYEKSGNLSSPRNPDGTSFEVKDSDPLPNEEKSTDSTDTSSTSFNPSLFSRNQPGSNTAQGSLMEKMHDKPIRQSTENDTTNIQPLPERNLPNQMDFQTPQNKSDDTSKSWMDKLGSIMGGAKDEESSLMHPNEPKNENVDVSVIERLRNAHAESLEKHEEKGVTETIKEKFDNWNKSTTGMFDGKENDRGSFSETVQEKMGEVKDKVGEVKDKVESYMTKETPQADPLLMKPTPIAGPTDVPDTNFLQNA